MNIDEAIFKISDNVDEDHTQDVGDAFFCTDHDEGKIIVDDKAIFERYSARKIDELSTHVSRIFPNKNDIFYSSFKKCFLAKKRETEDEPGETIPEDTEKNICSFLNAMKINLAFRKLPFKKKQICNFFDTTDDVEILSILTDFEKWLNNEEDPTEGYFHDFNNWAPYSKFQRKVIEDLKNNSTTKKGETVEYSVSSKQTQIQGKFQIYDGDDHQIIASLKKFENINVTKKQIEEARQNINGKILTLSLNASNAYVLKMKRFQCLIQPGDKCKVMDIHGWELSQKFRQQFGKKILCVAGLNDKKEEVKPVKPVMVQEENKKDEDLTDTDEDTEDEEPEEPPPPVTPFLFTTRPRNWREGFNTTQVKQVKKRKRKRKKIKAEKKRRVKKPIKTIPNTRNQTYDPKQYVNDFTEDSIQDLIGEMEGDDCYEVWTVKSFNGDRVVLTDEKKKFRKTCSRSVLRPDTDNTLEIVLKRKKMDALLCLIDSDMTNQNVCNDIWKYVEDDDVEKPQIFHDGDVVEKVCCYCGCRKLKNNREKNPLFRNVNWERGRFYLCNAHAVQYNRNKGDYASKHDVKIDHELANMSKCGPQENPIAPNKNTEYDFVATQKKLRLQNFVENYILKGNKPPVTVDLGDIWIQTCLKKMGLEPEIRKYTPPEKKKKKVAKKKKEGAMSVMGTFISRAQNAKKDPLWIMDQIQKFSSGEIKIKEFLNV